MPANVQSEPLVERLLDARRLVQALNAEIEEKTGITGTQALVLKSLLEQEGVSQNLLVTATGIDRSTLADVVRRLLARGLVARRRTRNDARAYAVRLTDAGKTLANKVSRAV